MAEDGQDRGGARADRLFGTAKGAQAIKLRLEMLADFGAIPFSRPLAPTFRGLRAYGQQYLFPGRLGNGKS
jgi:hypothetical protein